MGQQKLRVWLVQIGEPHRVDGASVRMMRTGVLAEWLAANGHQVTWWSSSFDHLSKSRRFRRTTRVTLREGLEVIYLWTPGYRRNVSLRRLITHFQLAVWFLLRARREAPPDVVFASMPSNEVAAAAALFGRRRGVPLVVEVRDPYPDTFLEAFPARTHGLVAPALWPFRALAAYSLRSAAAVIGISESFLNWGLRVAGRPRNPFDRTIGLGASPDPFVQDDATPPTEGEIDLASDRIVWFVGSFNRIIDLRTVIEAARILEARGRAVQFVLSGGGEQEARWRALAEGLANVRFTGWVTYERMAFVRQHAWLGLAPYVVGTEPGLRNKFFDYLAGRLPVVSSLQGETAALLAEEGFGATYREGDAEDLAATLEALDDDPARVEGMRSAAERCYAERFHPDGPPAEIAELLEAVVSDAATRR